MQPVSCVRAIFLIYIWMEGTSLAFQKAKCIFLVGLISAFTSNTKHSQRIAKVGLVPQKLDGEFWMIIYMLTKLNERASSHLLFWDASEGMVFKCCLKQGLGWRWLAGAKGLHDLLHILAHVCVSDFVSLIRCTHQQQLTQS